MSDGLCLSNVSNILSVGKMKHDMWLCNNSDTETNKIYIKTGYGIIIRWWTGSRLAKYLSKTHSLKINQIKKTDGVHNSDSDIQHCHLSLNSYNESQGNKILFL